MAGAAANGMTRITLSFLLSLLNENNIGPEVPANSKHHWSYKGIEGPQNWATHFKECAGTSQSPIDIESRRAVFDDHLGLFQLDDFDTYSGESNGPTMLNITNNGHAASVRVTSNMRVSGGGLNGTYKTAEFHFHWGSTDDVGSEHALDGRKFPLEMHIVNYAEKYDTINEAMTKPDGLAVLGVFFELSDTDNLEFSGLGQALTYVRKAGEHNLVKQVRLRSLLPDDISRYWRYSGSLTTPMCFESVTWTVFESPQKISRSQLDALRSLLHEHGHDKSEPSHSNNPTPSRLVDNWRPVQALNGRVVYRSFDDNPRGDTSPYSIRQLPSRNSRSRNNVASVSDYIVQLTPPSLNDISKIGNNRIANGTKEKALPLPVSESVPSKVKIKYSPTSFSNLNSAASTANPTVSSLDKNSKNNFNSFSRSQYQRDPTNDSPLRVQAIDMSLKNNRNVIQQLQKKQQLIERETQQQLQKLVQLQQRQQQLNNHQLGSRTYSQQFGASSSLLPNVQTLEAESQPGQLPSFNEAERNSARILNDGQDTAGGTRRGDYVQDMSSGHQSNPAITAYGNKMPIQQQQHFNPSPSAQSSQSQQRYVKPIDPNFKFRFVPPQNQLAFLQNQQRRQQPTLLQNESPSPSYLYSPRLPNQRQFTQQQSDTKNSRYSQINSNSQTIRQDPPSASSFQQQIYRTFPARRQRQNVRSRRPQQVQRLTNSQQQLISGSKMSSTQLRSLLEKLTSNTRQPAGPQTLMSPASRMLPPIGDVNAISRSGNAGGRRTIRPWNRARERSTASATRLSARPNIRIPSRITSGMNPVPYPTNQRANRVPGRRISSQIPTRLSVSSPKRLSSPSALPFPSPSSSFNYGHQPIYQFNRNKQQVASDNGRVSNRNLFYSDMNGQGHQEDLPHVFLHRIQKPVRIRRQFYERLYNV